MTFHDQSNTLPAIFPAFRAGSPVLSGWIQGCQRFEELNPFMLKSRIFPYLQAPERILA